jgi:hypothetical protein
MEMELKVRRHRRVRGYEGEGRRGPWGTRHGKEKTQKRKGGSRGRRDRQKGKREGESM